MKRRPILLALMLSLLFGIGLLFAMQSGDDAKFQKTLDAFMDQYWQFYPTAATLAGYHKYDTSIEDFSEGALEKRLNALDVFNKDFVSKITEGALSSDNKIDRDIILDVLEYDKFRHENLVPWEYNPLVYNDVIRDTVRGLFATESAPLDARAKSAYERLRQLPGFLKQAKDNLKTPAAIFTQTAIDQFPGIIKFYKEDLPGLINGVGGAVRGQISAELPKVNAALEDYQRWLQGTLLPKSTGNPMLGDQAHLRLLRLTVQGAIMTDELLARAKADYNNIRREMLLVAAPFYKIMYPEVNLEQMNRPQEEIRNIVIKGVLDKIEGEHAPASDLVSAVKSTAENVKSFLEKKAMASAPTDTPAIVSMPVDYRAGVMTLLEAPGGYENSGKYSIYVQPVPENLAPDKAESLMRQFNNFYLPFWAGARVYPGKFLPVYLARKNTDVVRRVFPNQPLLMGWSAGVGEQLINAGFGNYDLRQRLSQLKQQLTYVIDFQVELNIHQAAMAKDQVVAYYTRGGFVTEAEAERRYNAILLRPGEAAYTYMGLQEISDLEKDYRKAKGEAFNRKEFFEKLLANGAIPLRLLKGKIQ